MTATFTTHAEQRAAEAETFPAFSGFSLARLRAEVAESLQHFGRLEIFEEYTKHDITHVQGLLRIYDWLIPEATKERMSSADWLMIVMASYLHDFGLLVTRQEYENRNSTEFAQYKRELFDAAVENASLIGYLQELNSEEHREKFLYQEFVRKYHAARIRTWLTGKSEETYGFDPVVTGNLGEIVATLDKTFVADVALVCESHHLDDIYDTRKYPVDKPYGQSDDETANVQYAAIAVRAADLLHITQDRTPATAFQIINPRNPTSQVEWSKQCAVRSVRSRPATNAEGEVDLNARRDTIEVHANFTNSDGFFGLTSYLRYANKQIAECYKWAAFSKKRLGVPHEFPWQRIDSSHVEADGFEANPFEFQIDQHKILDLLTGHTLYNDTSVVVRELVQNAIDAVRLEEFLEKDFAYVPQVDVTWDRVGRQLTVLDNGTGMSQEVIEANFLRVGSSRYSDPQFLKEHPEYSAISRFGIGVLSAFMVADDVEVITISREEVEARQLTLKTVHGQYLIKKLDRNDPAIPSKIKKHGTAIKIKLRRSAKPISILETLKKWIVIPRCELLYEEKASGQTVSVGFQTVREALTAALLESGPAVEIFEDSLIDSNGDKIEVRTSDVNGVSLAYAVRWSEWFGVWEFLAVPRPDAMAKQQQHDLFMGTCVEGIRVATTSVGYRSSPIWSIADATGKGSPKTNVARDAIEQTTEYAQFLTLVYKIYVGHVTTEIERLIEEGSFSLTRITREANLLSSVLVRRGRFPSRPARESLLKSLEEVPAVLIEVAGNRQAVSLKRLEDFDELASIDSQVVRHMEFVLEALPGNLSVSKILSEQGSDMSKIATKPLLCLHGQAGAITDLLRSKWGISSISVNIDRKEILTGWTPTQESKLWVTTDSSAFDVGKPVSLDILSGLPSSRKKTYAPLQPDKLEIEGLDGYNIVAVSNRMFLLPDNPLLGIKCKNDDESNGYKVAWLASVISSYLTSDPWKYELDDVSLTLEQLIGVIEADQAFTFIDRESLREILNSYVQRIFDISLWQRRVQM